ncbi:MAG: ABC transporter ATP-binding protein [Peptoniphilaceae bacterium]|nr:ABC transporter ATP-binding protein [Peptoniphilaceae bacterium]MDD7382883.1 ABC transporter ATP-binding protein [Peptoniphilaceae bacterium]MDY3738158.1 ABC transporter ATP-binding protein [Peptoniphilaceae bacterium]
MINISNLKVKYKDKLALNIDDRIIFENSEKIGIIGSNGAGKSTLIKAILGLVNYDGNISTDIEKEKIAVHMQFNSYSQIVKTRDVMQMVINNKIENDENLMSLIKFFDFKKLLNKTYKQLSGGEKQKLTLILVMWQNSPLTIFDEVTTGLDFVTRQMLMEKLVDYYKDKSTTLLLVSHYYEELENICDKLLYLDKGEVLFFGNKKELFNKYCAKSVVLVEKNQLAEEIIDDKNRLKAMDDKIAVGFENIEDEKKLINKLVENNQNFQRLNESIELTVLNALEQRRENNE